MQSGGNDGAGRWKWRMALLVGAALAVLLAVHAPFLNGPSYWKWPWRRLDAWRYFPAMALCALPLLAGVWVCNTSGEKPRRWQRALGIGLLMLSLLAMQVMHIAQLTRPMGLSRIIYIVESPMNTSYYADAIRSIDVSNADLLANYSAYMPQFFLHSREKPPGPILFFRLMLHCFGISDQTALLSGLLIGLLATTVVPATYWLICTLSHDANAAFSGCVLLVLCPGFVLHFPMLDQLYPAISCLLIVAWVNALRKRSSKWSIAFGLLLAGGCFVVYHFLALGAFLLTATFYLIAPAKEIGLKQKWLDREKLVSAVRCSAMALAAIGMFYLLLYGAFGFNGTTVFRTALAEQAKLLVDLHRPFPKTMLFDLTDFALGAAWLPVLLAGFALVNARISREARCWMLTGLGQIGLIAAIGLMQAETARVWLFMLPLLLLPAGAELACWSTRARWMVVGMMWLLLVLVGQNMAFIY